MLQPPTSRAILGLNMAARPLLKRIAQAAKAPRDRVLILIGGYLGLHSRELSNLTAREARQYTQGLPIQKIVQRYIESRGLKDEDLMFRSQTYGGKLERTAIYRIISGATQRALGRSKRGGVRLLRALSRVLRRGYPFWMIDAVLTTGFLPSWQCNDVDSIEGWPAYYSALELL